MKNFFNVVGNFGLSPEQLAIIQKNIENKKERKKTRTKTLTRRPVLLELNSWRGKLYSLLTITTMIMTEILVVIKNNNENNNNNNNNSNNSNNCKSRIRYC